MSTQGNNITRFDARLPREQKEFFEKAASLGGYRNLTDFVIRTVQEKAAEIILEKEWIIASERDALIFFKGLTEPAEPNAALKEAFKEYTRYMSDVSAKNNDSTAKHPKRQK